MKSWIKHSRAGFTLIELVIAISILVLILGVAYGSLHQLISSKHMLDDQRDSTLIANAVLTRLTRELQLATFRRGISLLAPPDRANGTPPNASLLSERKELVQDGRGDSITFIASEGGQYLPDGGTHSGLVQIRYHVEQGDGSMQDSDQDEDTYFLVRDEMPYMYPAEEAYKKLMVFPITARLVRLEFQFYDSEKDEWVSDWGEERRSTPPSLIKFSLAIKSKDGHITSYTTAVPVRSEDGG